MDLTTSARVKQWAAGAISGSGLDDLIASLITDVSAQAEKHMGRVAEIPGTDRADYFDVEWDGQRHFPLKAWPATSITDVRYDPDADFGSETILPATAWLDITGDSENDGLLSLRTRLRAADHSLKVNYKGGMAADTAAFVAAYPDVAGAVDAQVFFFLQRRDTLGIESVSGEGGSITNLSDIRWLPHVRRILDYHRRKF